MKVRLQEIEFGTNDPERSKRFYQAILGLKNVIDQHQLNVFDSGVTGVELNTSSHFPSSITRTSFLTDDLQAIIDRLLASGVAFAGPMDSHLGMRTIEFSDPDGYVIRVNQPTADSPTWLKV